MILCQGENLFEIKIRKVQDSSTNGKFGIWGCTAAIGTGGCKIKCVSFELSLLNLHTLFYTLSFSHSRGYFPGSSTIRIFNFSFQGVFSWAALRSKSSFPHSRGYFPGGLYDSNLHFLILGGIFPGNSTIHISIYSFQGVLSQGALRFKSSFPHSRGYFPGQLYDSNLHFLILGGTSPADSTIQIDKRFFPRVLPQLCLDIGATLEIGKYPFPEAISPSVLLNSKRILIQPHYLTIYAAISLNQRTVY